MSDISNLKIKERQRTSHENWGDKESKFMYNKAMRIGKIESKAEYRMIEQFPNLLIFEILAVFQIETILKICHFFKL